MASYKSSEVYRISSCHSHLPVAVRAFPRRRKRTPTFYHLSFVLFGEGLACECNSTTRCIKTVNWLISQAGRASKPLVFSVEIFMGVLLFSSYCSLPFLPTFLSVIFAWSERGSGAIILAGPCSLTQRAGPRVPY